MLEQAVNDVHLVLHAIIHNLSLAIRSDDHQDRSLAVCDIWRHLDIGFRAVIEDALRANVFVAAFDLIVEVQALDKSGTVLQRWDLTGLF